MMTILKKNNLGILLIILCITITHSTLGNNFKNNFKKKAYGIETCLSRLMKASGYLMENDTFVKQRISDIVFFKKLKLKHLKLQGLKEVSSKEVKVSETSKYPDFEIQIWYFENGNMAEAACDMVEELIVNNSYFEKPPKLVSYYENYCIFITTPVFSKKQHIHNAMDVITSRIRTCM